MAEYTGSGLYLLWKGTQIDAHYRTFDPSETGAPVDASAGSDTHRVYLNTLLDGAASAEFVAQNGTAGTALWDALAPGGVAGTLEWGPEGTAVGLRRAFVTAILTTRTETFPYDGVITIAIEWQYSDSDGPTFTVYA